LPHEPPKIDRGGCDLLASLAEFAPASVQQVARQFNAQSRFAETLQRVLD
jgi:hypothetical protein